MRWRGKQSSTQVARIVAIAAVAAALVVPSFAAAAPRGCIVTNPANAEFPNPCTFRSADANAIYVASGDWELRIRRGDQTIVLSSASGSPATGALEDGDFATARALSRGSVIMVGNPRPDAASPEPGPDPVPLPAYRTIRGNVISFDGTTIAYSLYVPAGADAAHRVPAVIAGDGFGGDGSGFDPAFAMDTRYLLTQGYAVLTYAPRGVGGSGGVMQLDSYDYEARDISALIDMLAGNDAVLRDRPGDPRVGMIGGSYGGAIQLTAAARDHRIDAITPGDTWNNLLTTFMPEGVFRMGWLDYLGAFQLWGEYGDSTVASGGQVRPVDPSVSQAVAEGTVTGDWSPTVRDYFASRGPWNVLDQVEAPTLLVHATDDTLFPPSQAAATYTALRANHPRLPLKMMFLIGGHGYDCSDGNAPGCAYVGPQRDFGVFAWLERWLKRDATVDTGPAFTYATQDEVLHTASTFPAPAAIVRATSTGGVVVEGGEPDVGGGADPAAALPASGAPIYQPVSPIGRRQQPGVTTLKVPIDVHAGTVVGVPTVTLSWTGAGGATDDPGHAPLFFRIVDLHSDTVLNDQETPHVLATDGVRHTATFSLESVEWQIGPTDRLALEISSSSANFEPYRGAAAFVIDAVEVGLPVAT